MTTEDKWAVFSMISVVGPAILVVLGKFFYDLLKDKMEKKKKRTNLSNLNHEMQSDDIPTYDDDNNCEVQKDNSVPQYKLYPDEIDDLGYYDQRGEFHFNHKFDQTLNYEKNHDDGQNVGENSTLANNSCLPEGSNGLVLPSKVVIRSSIPSANNPTTSFFDRNQLGRQERQYSSNQTTPQLPCPARTRAR